MGHGSELSSAATIERVALSLLVFTLLLLDLTFRLMQCGKRTWWLRVGWTARWWCDTPPLGCM